MVFELKKARFFIVALMMAVVSPAYAQKDDLGAWIGAKADKKLTDRWEVGLGAEYRLNDDLSSPDRFSVGVSAKYKVASWLKASLNYDYLHSYKQKEMSDGGKYMYNSYWYPRHRVQADLTASKKFGRFKVSLRERWMYTYRPIFERDRMNIVEDDPDYGMISQKDKASKAENVLRSRLNVQYDIKKSKFTPYVSAEMFNAWAVQKVRYSVGTEYKINKQNSVKLFYLFEDKNQLAGSDPVTDSHIIGVEYGISL